MFRAIASNAITIIALMLFLAGGVIMWGRGEYLAEGPLDQAICLKVDRGSNFHRVSRSLEGEGAVSSAAIFRMGADYAGKTSDLKAGSFLIEPGASMEQIVDVVTRGGASTCGTEVVYRVGVTAVSAVVRELDPATDRYVEVSTHRLGDEAAPETYAEVRAEADTRYRLVFAEGVTSWQVVDALRKIDLLGGEVREVPPEGSLAPIGFDIRSNQDRNTILAQMQELQIDRVSEAWAARDQRVPLQSPEELVILASIIEKETAVADERAVVSSVFVNRLNRGMRLQTDPTVIYGITKGEGVLGRGIRASELRRATPWNTYVIEGLPPTPIANPGREALIAAGQPDNTRFLFFVADGTGGHAFAETLEEHNRNVARWREIEAERSGN